MNIKYNQNPVLLKMSLTQKIKPIYNEYKKFVNNNSLPDFEVVLFDKIHNKRNSTEAHIKFVNQKPILTVEQNIFFIKPSTVKSLLFHEFTHIFDNVTYLQNLSYEDRKPLLQSYTEYNATYVEMMCACGFKYISDNKKLDKSNIVYEGIEPKPITKYLEYMKKDYLATIKENMQSGCLPKNALKIWLHSIYLQSKIDFFRKYCIFNFEEYIETDIANFICDKNFTQSIQLIKSDRDKDLQYFKELYDLTLEVGSDIHNNYSKIMDVLF